MPTVLLVDDQAPARRLLYHALKGEHRVIEASDRAGALRALRSEAVDLVILDLHLPPDVETASEGVRAHEAIADAAPRVPIVVATGDQDRAVALDMVRRGVADFLLKPIDPAVLRIVVARALERASLERELRELREQVRERYSFGTLVGQSPAMRPVFTRLERLAPARVTVLLMGESGTGKSAVARALHEASARAGKPFVVVDGATIPEALIESELFGHARGAYTGADAPRTGRIQMAHEGTLFLDEIGNLSAAAQAKLLLFLDDRMFTPVGSNETVRVDVRLVAATNRDLERMVGDGKFREDLLFRLHVATIVLPPLRERREDIVPLAEYLLGRLAREMGRPRPSLTAAALARLEDHPWPGNVRQLKHVLESALVLVSGDTIDADDLPSAVAPTAVAGVDDRQDGFAERVAEYEKRLVAQALEKTRGNKVAAGRLLGLDENRIRYLCRKYGLG